MTTATPEAILETPGRVKGLTGRPPSASIEEERRYRQERLAGALRLFARFGYDEGVAGHITVRDPGNPEQFWVNPFGVYFGHIRVSNLILVDSSGEVIQGNHPVNRSAFAIHSRVHAARPDAVAAAHSHSMYGKAWSSLGRLLDPITQDACAFYQDHALFDDYTGVVYDTSEGDRIAEAIGPCKAVILRNHGLLTVGPSVEAAAWWFITMDRSCQAQLLAEAAGKPVKIAHEHALTAYSQVGNEMNGWFQFEPMWQRISREEPDLFD